MDYIPDKSKIDLENVPIDVDTSKMLKFLIEKKLEILFFFRKIGMHNIAGLHLLKDEAAPVQRGYIFA